MKRILFPTDLSEVANNAFEYALELARRLDATIDIINIYHLPASDAGRVPPQEVEKLLIEKKQEVVAKITNFIKPYPSEHIGMIRTDYGLFVYQEIADTAEKEDYDLIVMGTKGKHNNVEKLLGSTTTNLMMQAPRPVLAIPKEARYQEIDRIAYATDFQASDTHAVEKLMGFAKSLGASVHFVHVNTSNKTKDLDKKVHLDRHPLPFTEFSVVNTPNVLEGMEGYILSNHINLLALFIPRRRLWERLFHHSFSKLMAFHTKIPLLVFKE